MRPDIYAELEALRTEQEAMRNTLDALKANGYRKTWYSRTEAAEYLSISTTKLWELRGAGRLIGHQIDGRPLFKVDDLDAIAVRDA